MPLKATGVEIVDGVIGWACENSDFAFEMVKRTGLDLSVVIHVRNKKGKKFPPGTDANAGLHCRPLDWMAPYFHPFFLWLVTTCLTWPFVLLSIAYEVCSNMNPVYLPVVK